MKTTHINMIDNSFRIYCYKHDKIVTYTDEYVTDACQDCPYFDDTEGMSEGIRCVFDDACKEGTIRFHDAGDSEFHSKMQYHRLGMATKEEVLARLQSFNDYSDPEPVTKEGEEDIPVDTGEEE